MPEAWQMIPNKILNDEERRSQADAWARHQREMLAQEWADYQHSKADELVKPPTETPLMQDFVKTAGPSIPKMGEQQQQAAEEDQGVLGGVQKAMRQVPGFFVPNLSPVQGPEDVKQRMEDFTTQMDQQPRGSFTPMGPALYDPRLGNLPEAAAGVGALGGEERPAEAVGRTATAENLPQVIDTAGKKLGETLRNSFVRTRNVRIGESNQLALEVEKLLPKKADREALFIYRELKNAPAAAQQVQDALLAGDPNLLPYKATIEKALQGGEQFQRADQLLEPYFTNRQGEGETLGYVHGKIDDYITHIIDKGEQAQPLTSPVPRPPISKRFQFGQGRVYPYITDAIMAGKKPATLDVADVLRIYGERDAVANASNSLAQQAKEAQAGGWFHTTDVPDEWTRLDQYHRSFEHTIAVKDAAGNPLKVTQVFAVPNQVADAMKPVIEPDWLKKVGGIRAWRMAQSWAKYMELSLSFFHSKQLSIVSANSMGPQGIVKAMGFDKYSPAFTEIEKDLLAHGGTSPILGGEFEAFRNISRQKPNAVLDLPIVKQVTTAFDAAAKKTSGITFGDIQRRFKVTDYAARMAKWEADHPTASPAELEAAKVSAGKMVNGLYGGLNWEEMGMSKSGLTLLRTLLLAPDWTFSNLILPYQATTGQISKMGTARFLATSFATGIALTQGMNILLTGKPSDDPFSVTLGHRKDGTEAKANLFFAGDVRDLVNWFNYMKDQGPIGGTIQTASNKLAPGVRTAAEELSNRDFMGRQIRKPDAGPLQNTVATAEHLAGGLPVPFALAMPGNLIRSGQTPPLPSEIAISATGMGTITTKRAKPVSVPSRRVYPGRRQAPQYPGRRP